MAAKKKTGRTKSTRKKAPRKKATAKRTLSRAGREAISKAAKKRWRNYRKTQKAAAR
jgi:hypothetical protein